MFKIYEKELIPLYTSIGKLTVHWAWLEYMLDSCIVMMFNRCGGYELDDEAPISLKNRLKFFNRCMKEIESLSAFSKEGLALSSEIKKLSTERHDLAHGMLYTFGKDFQTFGYVRHKINKDVEHLRKSIKTIDETTVKVEALSKKLTGFSLAIFKQVNEQIRTDASGQSRN